MPRSARIDIEGVLQHVMVRGIEKRDIFSDDRDRAEFIRRLSMLLGKTQTECLAWALIPNHFHLLLRPTRRKLSELMSRLLTGYAIYFNRRHSRSGHLFQNRYKSVVCDEDSFFLELVRYIHLNPLRAGLVSSMDELDSFRWCGHAVVIGKRKLAGQAIDPVLDMFNQADALAQKRYRAFVADGIGQGRRDELVGGGLKRYLKLSGSTDWEAYDERILGSGEFVEHLWQEIDEPESPPSRSVDDIVGQVAAAFRIDAALLHGSSKRKTIADARAVLCYLVSRESGVTTVELAEKIGVTRSAIVHAAKRGEDILSKCPFFRTI